MDEFVGTVDDKGRILIPAQGAKGEARRYARNNAENLGWKGESHHDDIYTGRDRART